MKYKNRTNCKLLLQLPLIGLKIYRVYLSCGVSVIDVFDRTIGLNGGRKDIIVDYYTRLSIAF